MKEYSSPPLSSPTFFQCLLLAKFIWKPAYLNPMMLPVEVSLWDTEQGQNGAKLVWEWEG